MSHDTSSDLPVPGGPTNTMALELPSALRARRSTASSTIRAFSLLGASATMLVEAIVAAVRFQRNASAEPSGQHARSSRRNLDVELVPDLLRLYETVERVTAVKLGVGADAWLAARKPLRSAELMTKYSLAD